MDLFENQEICLIFVEIKTNKIMELTLEQALCIIHSGISNNDERELYDEASDVVMKEGKRLKLIYKRELINLELTKEIETELSNKKQGYSEEEVLEFTQTIIQQYKFGNTNIEQLDLLKETLELFKNK
jgi:hypothetical protein